MPALALVLPACGRPSLLITPVNHRRDLVETVLLRDSLFATKKIALIEVSGVITNSAGRRLLGESENPVSRLLEQLDKARRDPFVKAVVLRINSPGGTVVASELMHEEITHFKRSGKRIIAVMMDVAASGGYYIACACDEIVAQPSTITGSIGVVMQTFEISGTLSMIGVKTDAVTSGPRKDSGSPWRSMRPEERELFQTIIDEMHGRFVKVVALGRPELDESAVRELADGRVYTATQALELGLIDRIAGLRATFQDAKRRIGAKAVKVVVYHRPLEYRPNYYARASGVPGGDVNLLNVDLPAWLNDTTLRFMYLWRPGR